MGNTIFFLALIISETLRNLKPFSASAEPLSYRSFFLFSLVSAWAEGQMSLFRHSPQFGFTGVQMVCPNPTNKWLTSDQRLNGSHFSNATRVCSGSLVGFGTQPSLLERRWTWTSTPIPVILFQATAMHIWAILGPTPGRSTRSLTLSGMSEPYLSVSISTVCLRYLALFWKRSRVRAIYLFIINSTKPCRRIRDAVSSRVQSLAFPLLSVELDLGL